MDELDLWYKLTEEGQRSIKRMVIFKCFLLIFSISLFLVGFFQHLIWLFVLGGCLIIIYDILDMLAGFLKPLFPIVFAIILASIIKPWYAGVFWASAIWHIIGVPWYIKDLLVRLKDSKEHTEVKNIDIIKANQSELERINGLKENRN